MLNKIRICKSWQVRLFLIAPLSKFAHIFANMTIWDWGGMLENIFPRGENQTHSCFTRFTRPNQKAINTNTSVNSICLKQKLQLRRLKPQISGGEKTPNKQRKTLIIWTAAFWQKKKVSGEKSSIKTRCFKAWESCILASVLRWINSSSKSNISLVN